MNRCAQGFTIVELLIVIVVIGILAAITVVAFSGVQERAKVQSANTSLRQLEKAILSARVNNNSNLMTITGSNCTSCANQATYELTIDRIGAASGMNIAALKAGDPWGNRYNIDENEGEGSTPCANRDVISVSGGRTGIVAITIPHYAC